MPPSEHELRLRERLSRLRSTPLLGGAKLSGDWPAGQLGTLERNVLRIGIHELDEGTVPLEVVIDEAVTLAKRYSSEDAGRLVNGILGAISREAA